MAGSVNKVILVGNLGKDPEVRSMQSGGKVCNLSIATSERWRDKSTGENKEKTEWHRVVIFNERLSEVAEKYLRKGAKVYIEGQLETRKWQDTNGQDKYSTEVVLRQFRGELTMLDGKGEGGGMGQMGGQSGSHSGGGYDDPGIPKEYVSSSGGGSRPPAEMVYQPSPASHDLDDEIPFLSFIRR